MRKKRVLIIGMLDSIHIARWVSQFHDTEVEIFLFPSTHFKFPHRQLLAIRRPNIRVLGLSFFGKYLGYLDTIFTFRFINNQISLFLRRLYLRIAIRLIRPNIIHAIEIQHAGYLVSSEAGGADRRILTNWGSDIYYFQHKPEHIERIRASLKWASDYSAECARDYQLAQTFGFEGRQLPKIPNAGGFEINAQQLKCSQRDLIIVKSYGGEFGGGQTAIDSIELFLEEHQNFQIFFYSVTQDLLSQVQALQNKFPMLIKYSTLEKSIPHEELMELFSQARIYLGCSQSDGLSTSFLQALCTGAYPIQTNTSCADELIVDGAVGSIIPLNKNVILSVIKKIIFDDTTLDQAQELNAHYSKSKLDANKISELAKSYYFS